MKFDENNSNQWIHQVKLKYIKMVCLLNFTSITHQRVLVLHKFLTIALPATEATEATTYTIKLEEGAVKDAAGKTVMML